MTHPFFLKHTIRPLKMPTNPHSLRTGLFDVARGALILLVVWGHLLESQGFNNVVYFWIYMFHIPAFAMVSGVFAKATLPLLICSALYGGF